MGVSGLGGRQGQWAFIVENYCCISTSGIEASASDQAALFDYSRLLLGKREVQGALKYEVVYEAFNYF